MNRSKKLSILLGVLLVACAATLGVVRLEEHKEQIRTSGEVVLEVPEDTVQALSWEYEGESLAFHKEDGWVYDEDEAFPVSEDKIGELLAQFEAFAVSFVIDDVEDYGQYGLDDPLCTIRLSAGEQSYEILLGDYSNMDSKRYVSIGDGKVYLVDHDPLDEFSAGLHELIANDEVPAFDQATEIQFAGEENYRVLYDENDDSTSSADDVYFAELDGERLPLQTYRVENYLRALQSVYLGDYVSYNVTDEELRTYGLDEPDLTVTVSFTAEDETGTFTLQISRDPAEKADAEDDEDEEDEEITAYARVGDSPIVYQITASSYQNLTAASYDDLRHLKAFWRDFEDLTQIDISLEDAAYTITARENWGSRVYSYQGEELEIDAFQSALDGLSADHFTSETPTQKKEIGLTLWLEDGTTVAIDVYRYDGEFCLVAVDGASVSFVSRSAVVDLIEAVHDIVLSV